VHSAWLLAVVVAAAMRCASVGPEDGGDAGAGSEPPPPPQALRPAHNMASVAKVVLMKNPLFMAFSLWACL
jgi:hypothetical protein